MHNYTITRMTKSITITIVSLLLLFANPSYSQDSDKHLMSRKELATIIDELVQFMPDEEWPSLFSEAYAGMDRKYDLSNGETVYLILTDHGASTPWFKVFIRTTGNELIHAQLAYTKITNNSTGIEVIDEVPHAQFDLTTGTLSSWMYWRAGDNSESATWTYDRDLSDRFLLTKFDYDHENDGKVEYEGKLTYD